MKTLLRVMLPLLIVGVGVLGAWKLAGQRQVPEARPALPKDPLVRVEAASSASVTLSVEAQGTVEPRTQTRLVAEVSGRVLELSPALASGGFFAEGEILIALDGTDYLLNLELARAEVARSELRLVEEETSAKVARAEWESLARTDQPSSLLLHEPQLAEARALLAAARAALLKAERDVERCTLRAPYMGRVQSRAVDRGQFVERSSELARIFAVDSAEIRLPVNDRDLARLDPSLWSGSAEQHPAPPVLLRANFAGQVGRWEGRIVRTEGALDPRTRSIIFVAEVEDPYGLKSRATPPLLAGLFVDAQIQGRRLERAVTIPRLALHNGDRVFVFAGDGQLEVRAVSVLEVNAERVVLSAGIEVGELVILSPIEVPIPGMRLRRAPEARQGASQ